MLARLSKGEASVTDLARPFLHEMSLPAITKHIKVLERAGLVTKTKDAQFRPCRLKKDGLKDVADWMEEYRVYWEDSFDRLEAYLEELQTESKSQQAIKSTETKKQKNKTTKKGKKNASEK